jgi:hypothetical protein
LVVAAAAFVVAAADVAAFAVVAAAFAVVAAVVAAFAVVAAAFAVVLCDAPPHEASATAETTRNNHCHNFLLHNHSPLQIVLAVQILYYGSTLKRSCKVFRTGYAAAVQHSARDALPQHMSLCTDLFPVLYAFKARDWQKAFRGA